MSTTTMTVTLEALPLKTPLVTISSIPALDARKVSSRGVSNYEQDLSSLTEAERLSMLKQAKLLVRDLSSPTDLLSMHRESMVELTTVRTLLSLGVFQALPQSGSISLQNLAVKVSTSPILLRRLLRMVVATGLIVQLPNKSYAHTKHSRAYALSPGPGMAFKVFYDETFLPMTKFHDYLEMKGRHEPPDQRYSPCLWSENAEGQTHWDLLTTKPQRYSDFQKAMQAGGKYYPGTGYYDFSKLLKVTNPFKPPVLVDVGGGNGHLLNQILQAHPDIKPSQLVLQDLPSVVAEAKANGLIPADMQASAYDYNGEQPVKGAKAYLFRRVFHSGSDASSIKTLKETVIPAMSPLSRILIQDIIVPDSIEKGEAGAVTTDLSMLAVAGKERTIEDFRYMLSEAGLEITGVFQPKGGHFGMIEAMLARRDAYPPSFYWRN